MPELTPAAVITLPSSTPLAFSCVAPTRGSRSAKAQCVVARRPLSNPATPKMNAPVHTEVTYFAVRAWRRTNSMVSRSQKSVDHSQVSPGDADQIEGADSSQRCASARGRGRNRLARAPPISRQCESSIEEGARAPAEAP